MGFKRNLAVLDWYCMPAASTLSHTATSIRRSIIEMIAHAGTGHTAGSLGMTDVLTALYFEIMNHDPQRPDWVERDRLFLSNGHICPGLYATLAEAGYFPRPELMTLNQIDSRLQGHPHYGALPGIECSSGPLGQGISQACGTAWALKYDHNPAQVYCLTSDGEHQEGQTWEAYLFAAKYRLSNLTVLVDRNNIQINGQTEEIMPLEPLARKLEAFNWHVQSIDGHDFPSIIAACQQARAVTYAPSVIICNTISGKGVSFMEGDYHWHSKAPSPEQTEQALRELGDSHE